MFGEKIIKVIPIMLFLFCLLEIFELGLVISNMDKSEKLEAKIENSLKALEHITILLNDYLEGMNLEYLKDKKIKTQ
ncbi:hypothetical protein [Helicobacter pylori]|uniref:hypothetical protein n=1 Tax=Helicobacter pylori TaxID=210 RepID=UPI0039DFE3CE